MAEEVVEQVTETPAVDEALAGLTEVFDYADEGESDDIPAVETEPAAEEVVEDKKEPAKDKKETKTVSEVLEKEAKEAKAEPAKEPEAKAAEEKPAEETAETKVAEVKTATEVAAETGIEGPKIDPVELRKNIQSEITTRYAFSEGDVERMTTEPAKVLPELAGRLFIDIYEAIYYSVISQIPTLTQGVLTRNSSIADRERPFYEAFPQLNDPKYAAQLGELGFRYKEANPNATVEQAIQGIGKMAMAMFGLEAPVSVVEEPPTNQPKPVMPKVPAGARSSPGSSAPSTLTPEQQAFQDIINYEEPDS